MKRSVLPRWFFRIPPKAALFYLLVFLISLPFVQYKKTLLKAETSTLSRFIPDFTYLLDFRDQKTPLDKTRLQEYYNYFSKANEFLPNKADILGMQGYCAYYLGKEKEALAIYQQTILTYPYSFGFRYNLGAIYFKAGRFPEAISAFEQALQMNVPQNISFITTSRIFFPLMRTLLKANEELKIYLRAGFERCYTILLASLEQTGDFTKALHYSLAATKSPFNNPAFFAYHAGIETYHLGKYHEAVFFLQKSLQLSPDNPDAFYYLGLSLQKIGKLDLAATTLKKGEELKQAGITNPFSNPQVVLQIY